MGVGAVGSALAVRLGGWSGLGLGALTSLSLLGPLLDVALWHVRQGWRLYLGFAVAALASNLLALVARGGAKLAGLEHPGARGLAEWWPQAVATYTLCGLIAGLLSAWICFRLAARSPRPGCVEDGE
jgi:hypothetical protein